MPCMRGLASTAPRSSATLVNAQSAKDRTNSANAKNNTLRSNMPPQAHVCRVPPPSVAPTIPLSVVMRADQLRHGPRGSARRAQSGLCRCCHFAEPCPERPAAKRQEREQRPHLCRETTGRLSMRALSPVFGIPYCVDRAHMECSVRNTGRPGATRRAARRGWDSNPRKLALRWFSRPVLSSAQSPLQSTYFVSRIRYVVGITARRYAPSPRGGGGI